MKKALKDMTNEQLWRLFPIILTEHKKCWKNRYRREERKITRIIGGENIDRISHIGSTAVKGLYAKPTIDILLEIKKQIDLDTLILKMEKAQYISIPQPNNPPPHQSFYKGYTPKGFKGQVFHVHVRFSGDHDELYFRDYLKKHPDTANAYAALKQALKSKFEQDRDGYTLAKSDFIKKATKKAKQAYKDKYKPKKDRKKT